MPTPPPARKAIALFAQIRARHPDLPVILLTAWTSLESAVDLVKAGAADYLAKPWDDRKLLATVNNLLELSEARRELARHRTGEQRRRSALEREYDLRGFVFADAASERVLAPRLPGRALRTAGADHRPQRRGQGKDRRDRACQFGGEARAVRRAELRRAAGRTDRSRTVRRRSRRLHRRAARARGQVRSGRRRHAVPRRDRHAAAGRAGEVAARARNRRASSAWAATANARSRCASSARPTPTCAR